jgi:Phosphodiester glycosidase
MGISRPTIRRFAVIIALVTVAVPAMSVTTALARDNGLSLSGKLAAWGRNHHLSWVVDKAEEIRYGRAPSAHPADSLPDAASNTSSDTSNIPERITPVVTPALPGEGQWRVARSVDGRAVVWSTGIRPSRMYPSITATYTLVDPSLLRARLYNGTEVPGGKGWVHGNHVESADVSKLVFAFNGGFRKEHANGGYYTEGRMLWPLRDGAATIAIDHKGQMSIGVWGSDKGFSNNDIKKWTSIRQNLLPTVINGTASPELARGYWGGGKKGEIFILRSAVCERFDGLILFVIAAPTNATTLANVMVDAGCKTAMQLDQNESYPRGYVYQSGTITEVDSRMMGKPTDYLTGSLREFFAFFE